jgi:hypothetical protein
MALPLSKTIHLALADETAPSHTALRPSVVKEVRRWQSAVEPVPEGKICSFEGAVPG